MTVIGRHARLDVRAADWPPLGVLGEPELKVFRKYCADHFEIRSASQMPHVKDHLNDWQGKIVICDYARYLKELRRRGSLTQIRQNRLTAS